MGAVAPAGCALLYKEGFPLAQTNGNLRKSYGKIPDATEMPNLLDIQLVSYDSFLQADIAPDKREMKGLHPIFTHIFPITDVKEMYNLEYVNYYLG